MILSKCLCYFQTFHHQNQLCSVMRNELLIWNNRNVPLPAL